MFDQASACATGIAQKTVPLGGLRQISIPIPPIAEQDRVVAKVDELMALCDELEAAQSRRERRRDRLVAAALHGLNNGAATAESDVPMSFNETARFYFNHLPRLTTRPEHIQQLRQTILNLAVRGKLVRQDLNDEPASELSTRIRCARNERTASKTIAKLKALPEIEANAAPFGIPESWKWVPLQNLLDGDSQNGFSKKPDEASDGVPILRISAGTSRGDYVVAEEQHKLSRGIGPDLRIQFCLTKGDLLARRFNGNRAFVGRLSLFRTT